MVAEARGLRKPLMGSVNINSLLSPESTEMVNNKVNMVNNMVNKMVNNKVNKIICEAVQ